MARGNEIILSSNPKGVFLEGTIGDTSKPGEIMMMSAGVAFIGGEPTWVASIPPADGYPVLMAVLLADSEFGKTATDAFVSGTRCKLYVPAAGEDMNVLVGEGSTQAFAIGDRLQLKFNGALGSAVAGSICVPFISMEAITVTVPGLLWCRYTGR